jgi:hypothetical protein
MTEEERLRSCAYKVRHSTEKAARDACGSDVHEQCVMNVYPCRYCKGWHVGHRRGSKKICDPQRDEFDALAREWVEKFSSDNTGGEDDGP